MEKANGPDDLMPFRSAIFFKTAIIRRSVCVFTSVPHVQISLEMHVSKVNVQLHYNIFSPSGYVCADALHTDME